MAAEDKREDSELYALLTLSRSVYNSDVEIEARVVHLVRKHVLRSCHYGDNSAGLNVLNRRCDICGVLQSGAQELVTHRYNAHTGSASHDIYTCLICYNTFSRKNTLCTHITSKHRPFDRYDAPIQTSTHQPDCNTNTCNICSKSLVNNFNLQTHTAIFHNGEKPYECDVCHKRFVLHSTLKTHKVIHTEVKPYECDVCHKRYRRYSYLKEHKRIHTGEKPFKCDVCHKRFTQSFNLNTHKRIHTGEKPNECDVCHKRFAHSSNLNTHKRIHTGEKPHECDVCHKCFRHVSTLYTHKIMHTGEKAYKCDVCHTRFVQYGSLYRHMKKQHTVLAAKSTKSANPKRASTTKASS